MPDKHQLQCMEIWGGNHFAESCINLGGLDAWVYSRPYGGAKDGGDVHYLSSCATGRITRLLVADVSGHGEDVADTALALRQLMRRYVNFISQTRFLKSLNQQFLNKSRQGRFATAVALSYFAPVNELRLCNAGHPHPLIFRKRTGQWELVQQDSSAEKEISNIPLGVTDDVSYSEIHLRLNKDDMILCYTDSLIEARLPDGSMLGESGLCALLNSFTNLQKQNLIAVLLESISAQSSSGLTHDDITALLISPNNNDYKTPLHKKLVSPLVFAGNVMRSFRAGNTVIPWPELTLQNIGGAMLDKLNRSKKRG